LQRKAVALLDDDARDALRDHGVEEGRRLLAIGRRRQQIEPARALHRRDRGLDGLEKGLQRQFFWIGGCAHGHLSRGRRRGAQREQKEQQSCKHCNGVLTGNLKVASI
jgi:hypothetical protein